MLLEIDPVGIADPGAGADAWVAATASLATLMRLPVLTSHRGLMDVLEYSLSEVVDILGTLFRR